MALQGELGEGRCKEVRCVFSQMCVWLNVCLVECRALVQLVSKNTMFGGQCDTQTAREVARELSPGRQSEAGSASDQGTRSGGQTKRR